MTGSMLNRALQFRNARNNSLMRISELGPVGSVDLKL